jgi:predicted ATPase
MTRHVVTGALGGGKTTVLAAIAGGVEVVAEPARELIAEHRVTTGDPEAQPDAAWFVDGLVERSVQAFRDASPGVVTLFDRGLPDCVAHAVVSGVDQRAALEAATTHRYDEPVFLLPPWEEIYATDAMRTATFEEAADFFSAIVEAYDRLGYEPIEVPRGSVGERAAFIVDRLPPH